MIGARVASLLVALVLAAPALAQPRPPHPGPPGPPPHPHDVLRHRAPEIGLDDATVEALLDALDDGRAAREELADAVADARDRLYASMVAEPVDREAIDAAARALGDAETALRLHDIDVMLDVRAMLTPAEREALNAILPLPPPRRGPPPRE